MTDHNPQPSTFDGPVESGVDHFRPRIWLDPCLVGVLAAVISLAGAGRPSFWYDEAATVSASYSRSLPQLWQMLGNVDAVEGAYYLLMHGWFDVFPPTEFWSRAPSGLAVGGTAAGVVVLSKFFVSRSAAIASGVVCAILPRTTWAGIEARPYALSMMAAVWLTVLLVYAARRENIWAWACYGTVLALSVVLDVYLLLLVLAHALFICAFQRGGTVPARFAVTSGLAGCAATPLLTVAVGQAHQISWISPVGYQTVEDVTVQQYFERSPPFALFSVVVVVIAVALAVKGSVPVTRAARQLLTLAVAWLLIPTALIVGWSGLVHPIYTPRYLAFTAPALTLVIGICVAAVASRPWVVAALLALFTVAAAPNYVLAQRNSYAKYGMDYSQVADLISANAAPGDCLLVNDTVTFMPAPMRPLLAARPDAYRKLIDLTLWQRATDRRDVFDTNLIPEVVAKPLSRCGVVWIITQADRSVPARQQGPALPPGPVYGATPAFAVPHDTGFRLVQRWQFSLVQVIEAVR
jgi:mannosyltransferase